MLQLDDLLEGSSHHRKAAYLIRRCYVFYGKAKNCHDHHHHDVIFATTMQHEAGSYLRPPALAEFDKHTTVCM